MNPEESDQVSSTLHELTHLESMDTPKEEHRVYLYSMCGDMGTEEAMMNADSQVSYVKDVYSICGAKVESSSIQREGGYDNGRDI